MPHLKLSQRHDAPERPAAAGLPSRYGPGRRAAAAVASLRRAAAAAPKAAWRDHRLFTILAALSLIPRVLAVLAFRPAMLTTDSFLYMQEASQGALGQIRPSGYSWFLDVFRPLPHPLLAVTVAQHLIGVAIAVIVYGLLRYRGLPAWGASLAAAPTLFDSRQIALESYVLPDTLYALMLLIAVALLLTRRTPRLWQCLLAGLCVAYACVLRGNGLPLAALFAIFIGVRRVGWRAVTAAAAAFAVPVIGYVLAFHASYGQYNITDSDGVFLWSRTTSFANCSIIRPPAKLAPLCPDRDKPVAPAGPPPAWSITSLVGSPTPADYLWAPDAWWRHDARPGINSYNNELGLHFAIDAVEAQPTGYLRATGRDVMLLFLDTDRPVAQSTMSFTATPHIAQLPAFYALDEYQYAGIRSNTYFVQPYAYFLFLYQMPVYFPGIAFFLVLAAGLAGVVRSRGGHAALPWALAAASIVAPAMLTQSLYRYTIVAIPLACLAAAMAFAPGPRRRSRARPHDQDGPAGDQPGTVPLTPPAPGPPAGC